MVNYVPRNDYVLIRLAAKDKSKGGVALPDISSDSKDCVVVAVGPKVEGLKPGDVVLGIGQHGITLFRLPDEKDLVMMKQEFVILVKEDSDKKEVH